MLPARALLRLLWLPRLLLFTVFITHSLGKITAFAAFEEKFSLPGPVVVLLILAELCGALGVVTGGLVPGRLGLAATWIGCSTIAVSQIGAIAYVRWPEWFEMYGGAEYNVVLVGTALFLALAHRAALRMADAGPHWP